MPPVSNFIGCWSPCSCPGPRFDEPVKPGRWSRREKGSERWVKPQVVVEVSFSEWTPDGHIRHPSFKGVRTDKPAGQISREPMVAAPAAVPAKSAARRSSVKLTHPERGRCWKNFS